MPSSMSPPCQSIWGAWPLSSGSGLWEGSGARWALARPGRELGGGLRPLEEALGHPPPISGLASSRCCLCCPGRGPCPGLHLQPHPPSPPHSAPRGGPGHSVAFGGFLAGEALRHGLWGSNPDSTDILAEWPWRYCSLYPVLRLPEPNTSRRHLLRGSRSQEASGPAGGHGSLGLGPAAWCSVMSMSLGLRAPKHRAWS